MRLKITDIPAEGKDIDFELDTVVLNERVHAVGECQDKGSIPQPDYVFLEAPRANLHIDLEGSTVVVTGSAEARFTTPCSRCTEPTSSKLQIPIRIILKPKSVRDRPEETEDMNFGYYDGREVECAVFVEDFLILALPYSVLCSEGCQGLCSVCGANLNTEQCSCAEVEEGDARLSVLRELKLV